jgi:hypothetical protein
MNPERDEADWDIARAIVRGVLICPDCGAGPERHDVWMFGGDDWTGNPTTFAVTCLDLPPNHNARMLGRCEQCQSLLDNAPP